MLFSPDGRLTTIVEVESSTKITTSLTRMQSTLEALYGRTSVHYRPQIDLCICADDGRYEEFSRKASLPQFAPMSVRFLPFSTVAQVYHHCVDGAGGAFRPELFHHFSKPALPCNKC